MRQKSYVFGTTWRTLSESLGNRRATQPLGLTLPPDILTSKQLRLREEEQLVEAKVL